MNPVIRAQLREFAKANSITADPEEKQFEIYAIYSILSGLLGETIDSYDVHLDGDEFGVDGIAVVIQGELVRNRQEADEKLAAVNNPSIEFIFFQAKTSTSYDYGDISKFFDAVIGVNRAVFFDNIRDYDSKSKINISIKESVLSGGGAEFVFRNNGITVVSKNIDRTGDTFRLEDFQIVNGCQTSNIIFDLVCGDGTAVGPGGEDLALSIQVPFRLIGSKDDDFVSSIIVGTNRQNLVRDEQFWALRPFMKSLEEYCRNLDPEEVIYFERRENQYRNQEIERTRIMQPSVLMKAVAACLLFQPQRAARDYRGILSEYEETIFLDDHDVRIYHAVCYLYYRLEFLWRNQRIENRFKTFRYYILAGVGLHMTRSSNVFGMKKAKLAATADAMIRLCKDEEGLKAAVIKIVSIIEIRLKEMGVTTQERIRDTIRSETFSTTFRERLLATDIQSA
ncbi:AIPR family protein [Bradyrhizobium sp. USDA 3256]